jgi:hypothetical protein
VKKRRTLIEGPEWDKSRHAVDRDVQRFDEAFRFIAYNISAAPKANSTQFLTSDHRVLISPVSLVADLWVYFRIEPDGEACTLLWIVKRTHNNLALRL